MSSSSADISFSIGFHVFSLSTSSHVSWKQKGQRRKEWGTWGKATQSLGFPRWMENYKAASFTHRTIFQASHLSDSTWLAHPLSLAPHCLLDVSPACLTLSRKRTWPLRRKIKIFQAAFRGGSFLFPRA